MKTSIFILVFVGIISTTKSFSQESFIVVVKGEGAPVLLFSGFAVLDKFGMKPLQKYQKAKNVTSLLLLDLVVLRQSKHLGLPLLKVI